MDWNHSETIALASEQCTTCHGSGQRSTPKRGNLGPCPCVFRAIFRACYARFCECAAKEKRVSQVSLEHCDGGIGGARRVWGRRDEEYMADFCLIAKRTLDPFEHRLFRYHYMLGADWRLCCRQLQMERGLFFHAVYRIQQKLGATFREIRPYSLFPLDEYFGGKIQKALPCTHETIGNLTYMKPAPRGRPKLTPPLRKIA